MVILPEPGRQPMECAQVKLSGGAWISREPLELGQVSHAAEVVGMLRPVDVRIPAHGSLGQLQCLDVVAHGAQ
jgi:hypothetical protein